MVGRETRRRGVRLGVERAYPDDRGTQRVRLDADSLLHLGASPGDTVEIQGVSLTFGVAAKARVDHYNLGTVYLPELVRENASVRVGEMVTVEAATLEPAAAVRLEASGPAPRPLERVEDRLTLRERLYGRPVCLGDELAVPVGEESGTVTLRVAEVEPDDSVVLGPETDYEIVVPGAERARPAAGPDLD